MEADFKQYHQSIGKELQAVKDRVRQLIGDRHWVSDGRYKEEILKNAIKNHLPEEFAMGSGFVIGSPGQVTTQIDIIIYEKTMPVLFRNGDFVIINADGVRAIIEVKTRLDASTIKEAVYKASANGQVILSHKDNKKGFFNGIFSFEEASCSPVALLAAIKEGVDVLKAESRTPIYLQGLLENAVVNHLAFGENIFIKLWDANSPKSKFNGYTIDGLSNAYFIFNLMHQLSTRVSVSMIKTMFPLDSKEVFKYGEILLCSTQSQNI